MAYIVEVCLKHLTGTLDQMQAQLEEPLKDFLIRKKFPFNERIKLSIENGSKDEMLQNVESLLIDWDGRKEVELSESGALIFHFYWLQRRGMEMEMFDDGDGGDESVPSSSHWILPSYSFEGLWENLVYESGLKEKLLKFALSALMFSRHKVNQNIISCNRLILLHGPPGTGKTSLCKALAHKLAIRCRAVYRHTHLIEINSHSLFSKWFSESGKLVMKLFAKIKEIVADTNNLVCVLIDEVESLAYARDCMSGQEPKDAMRVVNALLTQLDSIKEHANVLILATSNLADNIDLAFLDRADIKQYIDLPNEEAIRKIYDSMLLELARVNLIYLPEGGEYHYYVLEGIRERNAEEEHLLQEIVKGSKGLSGRSLRKLPFLAHATYSYHADAYTSHRVSLISFLQSLKVALEIHQQEQHLIKLNKNV